MTLYLPDGSAWAGTPHEGMAQVEAKAASGIGVGFVGSAPMLSDLSRSPQKLMLRAQAAFRTNTWIGVAESVVTRKVQGLPWHFEDDDANEFEKGEEPSQVLEMREVFNHLIVGGRTVSWYDFEGLLSRHIGLCGMGYIYLDQTEALSGTPLGFIYVNPARVWAAEDKGGALTGWVLDAQDSSGRGGTPYSTEELIPFYLDQPDFGHYGIGLYERLMLKSQATALADQHATYVLATGGRIAGIVAPKEGSIPDDKFKVLLNEFRAVNEAPDAAKRTTVMQGPTEFMSTAANPTELNLVELSKMNRDDILAGWGVPPTQAGIPAPAGLNSGDTKAFDEAILMQGSVHDRVMSIRETLQLRVWDRWRKRGQGAVMVIEEPSYDDDTPAYERASKAQGLPLTRNQRLEIVNQPPLPDYDLEGNALGLAIDLPSLLATSVAAGPGPDGKLKPLPEPPAPPPLTLVPPVDVPFAKAGPLRGLRYHIDQSYMPRVHKAVAAMLRAQRRIAAEKLRAASDEEMKRHKNDPDHWFNTKREDVNLSEVLTSEEQAIAHEVVARVQKVLPHPQGKADPFADKVVSLVLAQTGQRVRDINETTRAAIVRAILAGFEAGESPAQVADRIEILPAFDESRAELVARTETMLAYNQAALGSYREYGVERVQAIDGDGDEECAARDGQEFSLEEAMTIEDHPNGTLDWAPIKAKPLDPMMLLLAEMAKGREPVSIRVSNPSPSSTRTIIDYDDDGNIVGSRGVPTRTVIDYDAEGMIVGSHEMPYV